jgi:hypothetical protein
MTGTAWLAVDPPPPRRSVPCQLFDERLVLVADLLADGQLHRVPSGHLLVTVARPGYEAIDRFVDLEPDGRYLLRFFGRRDDVDRWQSSATGGRMRLRRQVGLGRYEPAGTIIIPGRAASLKVAVPRRGIIVAELTTGGADRVIVSLPPAREGPGTRLSQAMRINLEAGDVGRVVLEDDDLLQALNFLHCGQLREARRIIEPTVKDLQNRPPQDAVEAVVVGYVLLATHELHAAASWCADLPATEPWLPDAFVIAAEWFAAGGHHLTASAYLRQLAEAGLPLFTYGYERAVARLRFYESEPPLAKPGSYSADSEYMSVLEDTRSTRAQELAPWDRSACSRTLAGLAQWSPSIDRAAPTLTVRGLITAEPARRGHRLTNPRAWFFGFAETQRSVVLEREGKDVQHKRGSR